MRKNDRANKKNQQEDNEVEMKQATSPQPLMPEPNNQQDTSDPDLPTEMVDEEPAEPSIVIIPPSDPKPTEEEESHDEQQNNPTTQLNPKENEKDTTFNDSPETQRAFEEYKQAVNSIDQDLCLPELSPSNQKTEYPNQDEPKTTKEPKSHPQKEDNPPTKIS